MRVLVVLLVTALFITLPAALLTQNATVLLSPAFVNYQYDRLGVGGDLPEAERRLALDVVRYLRASRDLDRTFTERELAHLEDVRDVFSLVFALRRAASIALGAVLALLILMPATRRRVPGYLMAAGLVSAGLMGLLLVLTAVNFDWLFTRFHTLFFAGASWLFPDGSQLIRLFPNAFWVNAAVGLATLTVAEALLISGVCRLLRQWRPAPAG